MWAGRVTRYHVEHTRTVITFRWLGQDDCLVTVWTQVKLLTKQEVRAYTVNREDVRMD